MRLEGECNPAILAAEPGTDRRLLDSIEIVTDPRVCALGPLARRIGTRRTIEIGGGFLAFWLYAEQARVLLALSAPKLDTAVVASYFRADFHPAYWNLRDSCDRKSRNAKHHLRIPSVLLATGMSVPEYSALMLRYRTSRAGRLLQRELFLSLMFLLIHEAAHHIFDHPQDRPPSSAQRKSQERAADDFALRVFEKEALSTSLGLGGVVMLALANANPKARQPEDSLCRIGRVFAADRHLDARLKKLRLDHLAPRIKRIFADLVDRFSAGCRR